MENSSLFYGGKLVPCGIFGNKSVGFFLYLFSVASYLYEKNKIGILFDDIFNA